MRMMPVSPCGTSAPASSTSTISTPASGRPTVCSSTSAGSPGSVPVIDDDSVHAYRTTIGHPRRCPHLLRQLGRYRRGAGGREPQRRQVGVLQPGQVDQLRPLRRHTLAAGDALLHHEVEQRFRRPDAGQQHARDHERHLVPDLVHVAGMRERQRHGSAVEGHTEDAAHLGRRPERPMVEPRALRRAGGPARPHDARGVLGADRSRRRERLPLGRGALHLVSVPARPRAGSRPRAPGHRATRGSAPRARTWRGWR